MTPKETARGAESAPHTYSVSPVVRRNAAKLQREGLTLSEVAEGVGYEREAVVQVLYWEKVRP